MKTFLQFYREIAEAPEAPSSDGAQEKIQMIMQKLQEAPPEVLDQILQMLGSSSVNRTPTGPDMSPEGGGFGG